MFTYDPTIPIGLMRAIIPDRDASAPVFQDAELQALYALEGDERRGSALALESIASDLAATLRFTQSLGLTVDGTKASDAILKRATALRDQALDAEARAGALFDVAEMALDDFSARERVRNEILRQMA